MFDVWWHLETKVDGNQPQRNWFKIEDNIHNFHKLTKYTHALTHVQTSQILTEWQMHSCYHYVSILSQTICCFLSTLIGRYYQIKKQTNKLSQNKESYKITMKNEIAIKIKSINLEECWLPVFFFLWISPKSKFSLCLQNFLTLWLFPTIWKRLIQSPP